MLALTSKVEAVLLCYHAHQGACGGEAVGLKGSPGLSHGQEARGFLQTPLVPRGRHVRLADGTVARSHLERNLRAKEEIDLVFGDSAFYL